MRIIDMAEALDKLKISRDDLETLIDLKLISVIVEDGKYYFTEGFISSFLDERNKKNSPKNPYIPKCDVEMLKNDKWEKDKS